MWGILDVQSTPNIRLCDLQVSRRFTCRLPVNWPVKSAKITSRMSLSRMILQANLAVEGILESLVES